MAQELYVHVVFSIPEINSVSSHIAHVREIDAEHCEILRIIALHPHTQEVTGYSTPEAVLGDTPAPQRYMQHPRYLQEQSLPSGSSIDFLSAEEFAGLWQEAESKFGPLKH